VLTSTGDPGGQESIINHGSLESKLILEYRIFPIPEPQGYRFARIEGRMIQNTCRVRAGLQNS